MKAAKKEVLFIPDDAIVLANTLCLLDFDCEMLNSITDIVKVYTTESIPTVLTTFLLSGLCQPYKKRYSGSLSKFRTCTTFNSCLVSNSWTVYEDDITIGVAGCELPHISAQNIHFKDFQSLVELRLVHIINYVIIIIIIIITINWYLEVYITWLLNNNNNNNKYVLFIYYAYVRFSMRTPMSRQIVILFFISINCCILPIILVLCLIKWISLNICWFGRRWLKFHVMTMFV